MVAFINHLADNALAAIIISSEHVKRLKRAMRSTSLNERSQS